MGAARIITVEVPEELLERAQKASGEDVAGTVRKGLELVAVSDTCRELLKWKGKVPDADSWEDLKHDR